MELDAKARIAALNDEMDSIHYTNLLYWQHKHPTKEARAEYNFRNERLENIRTELAELRRD
jgi:hypothetical protein